MKDTAKRPASKYADPRSFSELKDRILSNARAFYAHTHTHAERFDLITVCSTKSRDLYKAAWQASLIVYPDPRSHEWLVLYKSGTYATVEDAAFEVCYWGEEDMRYALSKVEVGETYAPAVKEECEKSDKKENNKEDETNVKEEKDEEKQEQKDSENVQQNERVEANGGEFAGNKAKVEKREHGEASVTEVKAEVQASAATVNSQSVAKRKASNASDNERLKSVRTDDEERVFLAVRQGASL